MRLISSWLAIGVGVAATLMMPFAGSSCGRSACIVVSQSELEKGGGVCPTEKKALPRFTPPGCNSPVSSVDGPGELEGQLCCYPVTQVENDGCFGSIGVGGSGGFCGDDGAPCSADSDCCASFCGGNGICSG